ncbi:MAG: homocysteine S-methyltransferase family protein [Clostridia bacterium]|nr:homocysteine S-methyltransferase family protein [Clostridia bacterium]
MNSELNTGFTYLDGAMGTMLQARGLRPGELPEMWNMDHPDIITEVHYEYLDAGSDIILTNTFGAYAHKFGDKYGTPSVGEIVSAAVENARAAVIKHGRQKRVALDIGPTGKMLAPFGDFDFEEAVSLFAETVRAGVKAGVDLIFIETMTDSRETKAAVLAAKEQSKLPVLCSNVYDGKGKLMTGATPEVMAAVLEGLGVSAYGMNCSAGPDQIAELCPGLYAVASRPLIFKPNAGLPRNEGGRLIYDVTPDDFASQMTKIAASGGSILGGCCGTTPDYIRALVEKTKDIEPLPVRQRDLSVVTSYSRAVYFGGKPVLIGERINPTGRKAFKEALRNHDIDYIIDEGMDQADAGADILDVNVGLPEIDEPEMMEEAVTELQSVLPLPLCIDTSDTVALERAMRLYNGKPLINSVNGKKEVMDVVFPLQAKYGGVVIGLTLDENGIPDTVEGRLEIARRIYAEADGYGISRSDIIIDPLCLSVSSDPNAALTTIGTVRRIKSEYGGLTSLGVSNVSFGLPRRDIINAVFFTMALTAGLDAAIINPFSDEMIKAFKAFCALSDNDAGAADYIDYASGLEDVSRFHVPSSKAQSSNNTDVESQDLKSAIIKGLKDKTAAITAEMLRIKEPLDIVNGSIVPALNEVGEGFEKKTMFLPQLLMSADAATRAFAVIRKTMAEAGIKPDDTKRIILATVKGDIHDIGKNILKVLLENYGFTVIDLGKDVPPEKVVEAAKKHAAGIVGLSALMTTTVPAMKETVELVHKELPGVPVMVGGAVLTQEYADMIGADYYGKDAMASVKIAQTVFG